jgi:tetratricopeptide (TPR) repeat protein
MYYQLAIKRYPKEVIYWVNLSYVEYSLGQHKIAIADALKAKNLLPDNVTDKLYELMLNNSLSIQK